MRIIKSLMFLVAACLCVFVIDSNKNATANSDLILSETTIVYVNRVAAEGGDGSSWPQAFTAVGEAIASATSGTQIWVAAGTYDEVIQPSRGTALYGGFVGDETILAERDIEGNPTILDGEAAALEWPPALHVVALEGVSQVRVDGFTIQGGYKGRSISTRFEKGGGVFCIDLGPGVVIANCTVTDNESNYGGGMAFENASPLIVNCAILRNYAARKNWAAKGGGIHCDEEAAPEFRNCFIANNEMDIFSFGGGVFAYDASPRFVGCVFSGNASGMDGGAISAKGDSSVTLVNSILTGNSSAWGEAIHSTDSVLTIVNCTVSKNASQKETYAGTIGLSNTFLQMRNTILSHNDGPAFLQYDVEPSLEISHCLFFKNAFGDYLDGASGSSYPGEEPIVLWGANAVNMHLDGASDNHGGDPRFADLPGGDFHLLDGSTALDRGNASMAPVDDFEGDPRPGEDSLVDIGADEAPGVLAPQPDQTPPVSRLNPLPSVLSPGTNSLTFSASDAETGVQFVELFFRKDGGEWLPYGESYTENPVLFNSTTTGGAGRYNFYTIATDITGNREEVPEEPDANTRVVAAADYPDGRIYVDGNATGTLTGRSWAEAFDMIGDALVLADTLGIGEVWVAAGTYRESLTLPSGIALYGGFAKGETDRTERDLFLRETIIDASKADDDGTAADHVVVMDSITSATFDGFTLTGALANDGMYWMPSPQGWIDCVGGGALCVDLDASNTIANCRIANNVAMHGGGVYCYNASPNIIDCVVEENIAYGMSGYGLVSGPDDGNERAALGEWTDGAGGGVCVIGNNASPRIVGCTIQNNRSEGRHGGGGGGLYCYGGKPAISRTRIIENNSQWSKGGGVSCRNASVSLTNCVIAFNAADSAYDSVGGGIHASDSKIHLTHCTISANQVGWNVPSGGGVYTESSQLVAINTIFEDSPGSAIIEYRPLADAVLRNCLFWNNPDGAYRLHSNVFSDERIAQLNTAHPGAEGNFAGDPCFASKSARDFRLTADSTAIDRGAPVAGLADDLDGNLRPVDIPGVGFSKPENVSDIGAHERQSGSVLTVAPSSIEFNDHFLHVSPVTTRSVVFRNVGSDTLEFLEYGVQIDSSDGENFRILTPEDTSPLAPDEHRALRIEFRPSTYGPKTARLLFRSNDPRRPLISIGLKGNCVEPPCPPPSGLWIRSWGIPESGAPAPILTRWFLISGAAEPGFTVVLKEDDTVLASGAASAFSHSGLYIELPGGSHSITAIAVSPDGVESSPSLPLSFGVDTTYPEIASITPLETAPLSGHTLTFRLEFTEFVNCPADPSRARMVCDPPDGVSARDLYTRRVNNRTYDVSVRGMSGQGAAGVIIDSGFYTDWRGNANLTSTTSPLLIVNQPQTVYRLSSSAKHGGVYPSPEGPFYLAGETVSAQANPKSRYVFKQWVGDVPTGAETRNPLTVVMNADKILSALFERVPPELFSLTVNVSGDGSVTESPNLELHEENTTVTLTAIPAEGYVFVRWEGVQTGEERLNPLTIPIQTNRNIVAIFGAGSSTPSYPLTVSVEGNGDVTKEPDRPEYQAGSLVILTANPGARSAFEGWSGDILPHNVYDNPLLVGMNSTKTITATFTALPPNEYALTLLTIGSGVIEKTPDQIAYEAGSTVTLIAAPEQDSNFGGWSGNIPEGWELLNPVTITMDSDKTISARFDSTPLLPLDAPTNVTATRDDPDKIVVSWDAPPEATHCRVYRSETASSTKTLLSDWQATAYYEDAATVPGATFYYWIMAAADAEGARKSEYSEPVEGMRALPDEERDYKITYKKCALEIIGDAIFIDDADRSSTIKISWLKKGRGDAQDKEGTKYLTTTGIPEVNVVGSLKKFTTDAPIRKLTIDGFLKALSAQNCVVETIEASAIGSIKMRALANSTSSIEPEYATTSIATTGTVPMKIALTGVILERLKTTQEVKSLKVASKAWKEKATKQKHVSLSGVGRVTAPLKAAVEEFRVEAAGLRALTAKGASIAPDLILSGDEIRTLKAQSKTLAGTQYPGRVGALDSPALLRVLAPGVRSIFGTAGVAGIFIAGHDAEGFPTYTGAIKSIGTKREIGALAGEAHVSPTAKAIKFKPNKGLDFNVYIAPSSPK